MASLIVADSISLAWERSLRLFAEDAGLLRFDSARGPCLESSDVVLEARLTEDRPELSGAYPRAFHPLVYDYASGFLNRPPGNNSTVSDRLYRWEIGGVGKRHFDQIQHAADLLRRSPNSRYNVITFWDPALDPHLTNPVSPLAGHFRLRAGELGGTLMARTVDAWLGGFPMFVGFAELVRTLAGAVGCRPGRVCFFLGSYHVYEMDLPIVRATIAAANG